MATAKTATIQPIPALTSQIAALVLRVGRQTKLLREDRIRAGKLLILLRGKFTVSGADGQILRGAKGSTFAAHLKASNIPIPTAYSYIAAAEGKSYGVSPNRVSYWLRLNTRMKKASPAQKLKLLRQAVAHLRKLYGIQMPLGQQ